ncbi:hypothetical protein [Microseira sp. BLCC-F43]|jgi:hypothetical protein|uniref:hypothetical protein n=1 Tax=Microseira sp. BLCC-F43 TaxID=3153602 RepID=UPI0035B95185
MKKTVLMAIAHSCWDCAIAPLLSRRKLFCECDRSFFKERFWGAIALFEFGDFLYRDRKGGIEYFSLAIA